MKLTNPALIGHKAGDTVTMIVTVKLEKAFGDSMVGYLGGIHRIAIPESAQLVEPDPRTVMASMFGEF